MSDVSTLDRQKIKTAGDDLISAADKMYGSLGKISDLINGSKAYFDSPAGNSLRAKFNASAEQFKEFQTFMKTYGEFLQNYSGNITKYEDAVQEAVNSIPNIG